jgi:hypothetical protein
MQIVKDVKIVDTRLSTAFKFYQKKKKKKKKEALHLITSV